MGNLGPSDLDGCRTIRTTICQFLVLLRKFLPRISRITLIWNGLFLTAVLPIRVISVIRG